MKKKMMMDKVQDPRNPERKRRIRLKRLTTVEKMLKECRMRMKDSSG